VVWDLGLLGGEDGAVAVHHSGRTAKSRRPCLVANRATLPQQCPPPLGIAAGSCELTFITKPTEPSIFRGRVAERGGL
jgi:hypothetical protein